MIGQTERDDKGVEAQFMKKKILVLLVCSMLTLPTTVSADILDYEGTVNAYKEIIRYRRHLRLMMEVERR